jgi:hypothetical protein
MPMTVPAEATVMSICRKIFKPRLNDASQYSLSSIYMPLCRRRYRGRGEEEGKERKPIGEK